MSSNIGYSFPLFFCDKDVVAIYAEQRLISMGWPLEDALVLCHSLKKDGLLEQFVADIEKEYQSQRNAENKKWDMYNTTLTAWENV